MVLEQRPRSPVTTDDSAFDRAWKPGLDPVAREIEAWYGRASAGARRLTGRKGEGRALLANHRRVREPCAPRAWQRIPDLLRGHRYQRSVRLLHDPIGAARYERKV